MGHRMTFFSYSDSHDALKTAAFSMLIAISGTHATLAAFLYPQFTQQVSVRWRAGGPVEVGDQGADVARAVLLAALPAALPHIVDIPDQTPCHPLK